MDEYKTELDTFSQNPTTISDNYIKLEGYKTAAKIGILTNGSATSLFLASSLLSISEGHELAGILMAIAALISSGTTVLSVNNHINFGKMQQREITKQQDEAQRGLIIKDSINNINK
jgi:hypothetical protein